jgi:hypothetical protein
MFEGLPTEAASNLRVWAKLVDYVLRFTHSVVSPGSIAASAFMRRREIDSPAPSRWIGSLNYAVLDAPVFHLHRPKLIELGPLRN